jgi:hypothetical protein
MKRGVSMHSQRGKSCFGNNAMTVAVQPPVTRIQSTSSKFSFVRD